jgi:hypothetical protein
MSSVQTLTPDFLPGGIILWLEVLVANISSFNVIINKFNYLKLMIKTLEEAGVTLRSSVFNPMLYHL